MGNEGIIQDRSRDYHGMVQVATMMAMFWQVIISWEMEFRRKRILTTILSRNFEY